MEQTTRALHRRPPAGTGPPEDSIAAHPQSPQPRDTEQQDSSPPQARHRTGFTT